MIQSVESEGSRVEVDSLPGLLPISMVPTGTHNATLPSVKPHIQQKPPEDSLHSRNFNVSPIVLVHQVTDQKKVHQLDIVEMKTERFYEEGESPPDLHLTLVIFLGLAQHRDHILPSIVGRLDEIEVELHKHWQTAIRTGATTTEMWNT